MSEFDYDTCVALARLHSPMNSYFLSPFWETNEFNEITHIFKMTEDAIYAFSPGRNYLLCSYWAAVPVLVYWTMKKHGHEIDLE